MSAIDTPDYQRGVVNAQILLAVVAANQASETVAVPPNCETFVVSTSAGVGLSVPTITGADSGVRYAGARAVGAGSGFTSPVFIFDVSDVIDGGLTVTWSTAPTTEWFIYSDAGTHSVADIANNRDFNGSQFVVPVVPYGEPGSHPPQEVSVVSFNLAANGVVLAAPGALLRYRIFGGNISAAAAGMIGILLDSISSKWIATCVGVGNTPLTFPPQGVPLTQNAALDYELGAGAGSAVGTVLYVPEVV